MAIQVIQGSGEDVIEKEAAWVAAQNFERVLDVGGAAKPLRCATHVLDMVPYSGRRIDEGRGSLPERFDASTWYTADACLHWPWPVDYFDYVWASQIVEDVRDPIGLCFEMQRVAPRGFISTVSRQYESSVVQADGVVGYHHHRWLIEVIDGTLTFTVKSPILQVMPESRPPHDPANWLLHLTWERPFRVKEVFLPEGWLQREELDRYLKSQRWLQ